MPKRLDFQIKYQKIVDRCHTRLAVLRCEGQKASQIAKKLEVILTTAELIKERGSALSMIGVYKEMKEFLADISK